MESKMNSYGQHGTARLVGSAWVHVQLSFVEKLLTCMYVFTWYLPTYQQVTTMHTAKMSTIPRNTPKKIYSILVLPDEPGGSVALTTSRWSRPTPVISLPPSALLRFPRNSWTMVNRTCLDKNLFPPVETNTANTSSPGAEELSLG